MTHADPPPPLCSGPCSGLRDKLYWRPGLSVWHRWHCFKKASDGAYVSLCDHSIAREKSAGQGLHRPPAALRCARCDALEMKRRGWDESGPESSNWRAIVSPTPAVASR